MGQVNRIEAACACFGQKDLYIPERRKDCMADKKKLALQTFGWGFVLWLIGYVLGIALFFAVPPTMIGWVIMPIGAAITIWVLVKKIERESMFCYFMLGLIWTVMAVALDYLLIVKAFNSAGYYKPDVFVYYALTFLLPVAVGWLKLKKAKKKKKARR